MTNKEKLMQTVLDKIVDGKKVFGTSFAVKQDSLYWIGTSGNISIDQSYFISSTTKLYHSNYSTFKIRTQTKS